MSAVFKIFTSRDSKLSPVINKFKNETKLTFQIAAVSSFGFNTKNPSRYIQCVFKCVVRISR
jgi:hypothetical protein